MSGSDTWHRHQKVPTVATMMASGQYLHERHAYLERKVSLGHDLDRCYCGEHRDEKAELARYWRKVAADNYNETKKEKLERLIAEYHALPADERKKLCLQPST